MVKLKTKTLKYSKSKTNNKKILKKFLVPHKSNQYKPHAIRWQNLAITALVSLITHVSYVYTTTGQVAVLGKSVNINISELANETNLIRKNNNLSTLVLDDKLTLAAQNKADDMIKNGYWSHDSPDGKTPWDWITKAGFKYDRAGENLAKNYPDTSSIISAWMISESHKKNILDSDFNAMGFASAQGVVGAKITTVVVAYYAKSKDALSSTNNHSDRSVLGASSNTYSNNPLAYIGSIIKNLSPITIGTTAVLIILIFVSISSHFFREHTSKKFQSSWNKHHGVLKASIILVIIAIILISASGSSI